MTFPNFVVIGSSRSGTTSLYHHLREHPQIYMTPVLEPRFFAFEGDALNYRGVGDDLLKDRVVTSAAEYAALFDAVVDETAIGEVSPAYLSNRSAPHRILHYAPDARIIAILRNPVDRALSSFRFEQQGGFETAPSLEVALDLEEARMQANWSYVWGYGRRGLYYTHLRRYFDLFERGRIKILRYEDWEPENGVALLREVFSFLGVDQDALPERAVHLNFSRPAAARVVRHTPSSALRARLNVLYRDEIDRLEDLTGLDLSTWRSMHIHSKLRMSWLPGAMRAGTLIPESVRAEGSSRWTASRLRAACRPSRSATSAKPRRSMFQCLRTSCANRSTKVTSSRCGTSPVTPIIFRRATGAARS